MAAEDRADNQDSNDGGGSVRVTDAPALATAVADAKEPPAADGEPKAVRFEDRAAATDTSHNSTETTASTGTGSDAAGTGSDTTTGSDGSAQKIEPVDCLYRIGRELGTGSYSVVKEAEHVDTHKWYAAKVINKSLMRGREHLVRNEVVVLKRVSRGHPNILTLVDYFETDNSLYLITELAKGGELFDRIYSRGSFYESDAAQLMRQIVSGVAHLHANGIVHRDLKPENLLFKTMSDSSNLLICDFGLSRIIDEENFRILTTTVGTPSYMAPEIITKKGHGKPIDIWALGVIAYLLLSGFTPFDRENPNEEREAIEKGEFCFTPEEYWVHVTSDAQNFIRACLQVNPADRPTAEECMNLPFLTRKYRKESDLRPALVANMNMSTTKESGIPSTLEGMPMNGAYSKSPEQDKHRVFSTRWG